MPRNVRNYWIETDVEGRKTVDASGPTGRTGGFDTTIRMRNEGTVDHGVTVTGRVTRDAKTGRLVNVLRVWDPTDGRLVYEKKAYRDDDAPVPAPMVEVEL